MKGIALLSVKHLVHVRGRSAILAACIAVAVFLPAFTELLVERYRASLTARAEATPLIAGAEGNRFDLALTALYFRPTDLKTIPFSEYEAIRDEGRAVAVPLNLRFSARGRPIVACGPEYHELRGLKPAAGVLPLRLGVCTLGAEVARELGLGVGDALFSDQRELYDISKPPALKMRVVGVLAPRDTPDDHAVFVDVKTAWILEGLSHGHADPDSLRPDLIMEREGSNTAISPAMVEYNEVTPETAGSFHHHGDSTKLPLSAILVFPRDDKARTMIRARVDASRLYQMIAPTEVIDDLLAFVFRIKAILDAVALLLAVSTGVLIALVLALSVRMRAAEIEALHRIGCSRFAVWKLMGAEIAILAAIGLTLAAAALAAALTFSPDLLRAA